MSSSDQVRFDFKHVRRTGRYSLAKLNPRQKRILERKLRDYKNHTMKSFENSKGVGLREVDLGKWKNAPSAHQQIQVRKEVSVDVPNVGPVWRFRVSGKMRVLGYMPKDVFFIVWVDPNHEMGG